MKEFDSRVDEFDSRVKEYSRRVDEFALLGHRRPTESGLGGRRPYTLTLRQMTLTCLTDLIRLRHISPVNNVPNPRRQKDANCN